MEMDLSKNSHFAVFRPKSLKLADVVHLGGRLEKKNARSSPNVRSRTGGPRTPRISDIRCSRAVGRAESRFLGLVVLRGRLLPLGWPGDWGLTLSARGRRARFEGSRGRIQSGRTGSHRDPATGASGAGVGFVVD